MCRTFLPQSIGQKFRGLVQRVEDAVPTSIKGVRVRLELHRPRRIGEFHGVEIAAQGESATCHQCLSGHINAP